MRQAMKRNLILGQKAGRIVLICMLILTMFFSVAPEATACGAVQTGLQVDRHSQEAIAAYLQDIYARHDFAVDYAQRPKTSGSYAPGKLSGKTLQGAVDMLNAMRYIAGIPDNVEIKESYNAMCQAGALVCAVNKEISHQPGKPAGMSNALYRRGYEGCSSSNLFMGVRDFQEAVTGWVSDEHNRSGANPGHRRWCLNPAMQYTGFGMVGKYSAMYCFDNWQAATGYSGVAWPAQQMPTEFFNPNVQWSVSFGRALNASAISVKLTRQKDGKSWNFSRASSDGQFLVSNENFGQKGCVIFKPKGVSGYQAGEIFRVRVKSGSSTLADYTVEFFSLQQSKTGEKTARPKATTIKKLSPAGSGVLTVAWGAVSCSGYQIKYSTSKSFKNAGSIEIKNAKTTKRVLKKLKKGKRYYIKVRAYRLTDSGRKVYGHYSQSKSRICQ